MGLCPFWRHRILSANLPAGEIYYVPTTVASGKFPLKYEDGYDRSDDRRKTGGAKSLLLNDFSGMK